MTSTVCRTDAEKGKVDSRRSEFSAVLSPMNSQQHLADSRVPAGRSRRSYSITLVALLLHNTVLRGRATSSLPRKSQRPERKRPLCSGKSSRSVQPTEQRPQREAYRQSLWRSPHSSKKSNERRVVLYGSADECSGARSNAGDVVYSGVGRRGRGRRGGGKVSNAAGRSEKERVRLPAISRLQNSQFQRWTGVRTECTLRWEMYQRSTASVGDAPVSCISPRLVSVFQPSTFAAVSAAHYTRLYTYGHNTSRAWTTPSTRTFSSCGRPSSRHCRKGSEVSRCGYGS